MARPTRPIIERFWEKVDRNGPVPKHRPELGPCWLWTDQPTSDGYGRLRIAGRDQRAHRLSWVLDRGIPIEDLTPLVLHHCDRPLCVRPSHLFDGDAALNNADRDAKGRGRAGTGDRHGSKTHPESVRRGAEKRAKLSPADVVAIRSAYTGLRGQKAHLARQYDISKTQVKNILDGTCW